jgi:hypothetical protein
VSSETLFYIFAITLTVSALVVSFAGLRLKGFPGRAMPIVALWFVVLVGGTTTFAVVYAEDEQNAEAAQEQKSVLPGGEEPPQEAVEPAQ